MSPRNNVPIRGVVNMYGVYQTFYESNILNSQTASNISWIGSIQAFLLFVGAAVAGPFFDMGYLRTLLLAGTFLTVFGMMMTSLCERYWEVLLAQGVTAGLGFGCLFLPSVGIVSQYFTTKKAFAFGIASTGSSIGQFRDADVGGWCFADLRYLVSRWHHISYNLPPSPTSDRLWLGNPDYCLHHTPHDVRTVGRDAATNAFLDKAPRLLGPHCVQVQAIPDFLRRHPLRLHGHLRDLFLCSAVCLGANVDQPSTLIISTSDHQRIRYSRKDCPKFCSR